MNGNAMECEMALSVCDVRECQLHNNYGYTTPYQLVCRVHSR